MSNKPDVLPDGLYSLAQAAVIGRLSVDALRKRIHRGADCPRFFRVGRSLATTQAELHAWVRRMIAAGAE